MIDNRDVRWYAALAVVLLAVFASLLLPRYEWKTVEGDHSVSVVVYDRWTGQFQRAVYDDSGNLNVMGAYRPF